MALRNPAQFTPRGIIAALAIVLITSAGTATPSAAAHSTTKAKTFSSGNLLMPIPDPGSLQAEIRVHKPKRIKDVNVTVRLDHRSDQDLDLSLLSPAGTTVQLANNRGGTGWNYGYGVNDCGREGHTTPTVFDDETQYSIATGEAPFAFISFQPESPLAALDRERMEGVWRLSVVDELAGNSGVLGCWTLTIRYRQR